MFCNRLNGKCQIKSILRRVGKVWKAICVTLVMLLFLCVGDIHAENYGGIEFPAGASSFADQVIRYDPLYQGGPGPTEPTSIDPLSALGIPDHPGGVLTPGSVALGRGGLIELEFIDNRLTNSGDSLDDLHIFEVGPDVEDTFVAIRPTAETAILLGSGYDANGDGFYEIGKVFGATSSIDIDAFFPTFTAGELRFDAVQLIDDPDEGGITGSTVGADIDAVGAIESDTPVLFGLTVVDPNGGEFLMAGGTYTITWETQGEASIIVVEYSADNGLTWTPVCPPNVGNSGSYEWLVPYIDPNEALVRVSDTVYPDISDTSDNVFTIYLCSRADFTGDCFVGFDDFAFFAREWLKCGKPFGCAAN